MRNPVNLRDVLPEGEQNDDAATVRLQQAYAAFTAGNPSREDCSIIMVDLAFYSGYYNTTPMGLPAEQVKFCEGRRDVFGRIVRYANMPLDELDEHQRKALEWQRATQGE